ncbi:MAG: DNA repair protein RecO [Lachnospiraceae bacterium]|nr:DNA repair protein RecO [Lachnospiraceae bacterium]
MSTKEHKFRGIVIREEAMGDKDKRLILLTEEMGRITVLAKGALQPNSKTSAITQLLCCGDYVLTKGKTFWYIKEAQLAESFYFIRQDLHRLGYATCMVEAAELFSVEGQENRYLIRHLLRGLMALKEEEGRACARVADAFLFRVLAENGYYPELTLCRGCGRSLQELEENESVRFDFSIGSLYCQRCGAGGIRLHKGALHALRYFLEIPAPRLYAFKVEEQVLEEMHRAVCGYLIEQTEKRYRGLEFIEGLPELPELSDIKEGSD